MDKKIFSYSWIRNILMIFMGVFLGWLFFKDSKVAHEGHAHTEGEAQSGAVWTCSMHPQIRQSAPGQCPICGMDLIPVSSAVNNQDTATSLLVHEMTPEAVALANVSTSKVRSAKAENQLLLTGKIQADEQMIATIAANFPGRVEQLFVNFTGQEVKKGQKLATVYSPELITAQKELLEAATTQAVNPALYEAAREKLRSWKINKKQIDAIEQTGRVQTQFDIYADRSGIVTNRFVSVGDYIGRGSALLDIVDLSRLWVMLDAYETDLPWIQVGDEVRFSVAALPGEEFKAEVSYIDPVINPDTRAATVRAETANRNGKLKPEMFVNATLTSSMTLEEESLVVPRTAVLWTGKRSVVYVKVPDVEYPAFEMREITLGPSMGELYAVEAGLEAGEEIVTNGVFSVDAAAQLSGNYSMMAQPENKTVEVPETFKDQLAPVTASYFRLKNALVDSEPSVAQQAAENIKRALSKVDMNLIKGEAHDEWMALSASLNEASDEIASSADIEDQRQHFSHLSERMIEVVESFGVQTDTMYRDYCPMAFGDEGAYWLSEIEEIRNPYMGEAMLTCGEVKETYRKGTEEASVPQQRQGGHQH